MIFLKSKKETNPHPQFTQKIQEKWSLKKKQADLEQKNKSNDNIFNQNAKRKAPVKKETNKSRDIHKSNPLTKKNENETKILTSFVFEIAQKNLLKSPDDVIPTKKAEKSITKISNADSRKNLKSEKDGLISIKYHYF